MKTISVHGKERSDAAIHAVRSHGLLHFVRNDGRCSWKGAQRRGNRSDEPKHTPPLLVLGWGNLSRGDDALGPLCVAALRDNLPSDLQDKVEFLDDYQLQIEHALDLIGRNKVLLIDASLNCAAPFELTELQAAQDASLTTHALSPQALLKVYEDLQGEPAPPCTLLAIRGEKFELGEPPSASALLHLQSALQWASRWQHDDENESDRARLRAAQGSC